MSHLEVGVKLSRVLKQRGLRGREINGNIAEVDSTVHKLNRSSLVLKERVKKKNMKMKVKKKKKMKKNIKKKKKKKKEKRKKMKIKKKEKKKKKILVRFFTYNEEINHENRRRRN